jgi:tRNA-splicing ligase RtcB
MGPSLDVPRRLRAIVDKAEVQLGTLGGGNHFLELQRGEDDGLLYFMIHSGSRSVGKKTCDLHHKAALEMNRRSRSVLPHDEVAYFAFESSGGQDYWADMNLALRWAEENRRRMAEAVIAAFDDVLGIADARQTLDVHHNYAAWEEHAGRRGIVHRKGAVRARAGELVLIPGSMSTGSYIARGLGNRDSFDTCQHGAGRARSRSATRKMLSLEQMDAMLEEAGVQLVTPKRADVIDEAAPAYKDIESVMEASADLVEPLRRLVPMGVVKG